LVAGVALALLGACSRTVTGTGIIAAPGPIGTPQRADNGVAALPPAQILTKARDALANSPSVHIVGSGRTNGQQLSLDLRLKGKDGATGSLTLPAGQGSTAEELRFQLIIIGQTAYLKADRLVWVGVLAGDSAAADKLAGKWLKTSLTNAKVKPLLDIANPAEIYTGFIKPDNTLAKGKPKKVHGLPTIGVVDQGSTGSTIYVATRGEPVPVQIVETGADAAVIDFSEYGALVNLIPPAPADTVDGSTIGL
jgi:hypothetical protein